MKYTLTFFIAILYYISAFSQQPTSEEIDDFLDQFLLEEDEDLMNELLETTKPKHFLYTSLNFNSNTYFAGRAGVKSQINLSPQITYLHTNGFWGGVSGLYLDNEDPKWDVTILSTGYGKKVNNSRTLRLSGSYARYFFSQSDEAAFENVLDIGINARTKNKFIGTSLNFSYLFGEETSLQATSRIYSQITLTKKASWNLKLRPQISFFGGTQDVETLFINSVNEQESTFANEFVIFNSKFYFPFQLTINDWDFELGYLQNIPFETGIENNLPNLGLIQFSVGYFFNI